MEVRFTRTSDVEHLVEVTRDDGTTDRVTLNTRSFLRHDLAHWAVESVLGLGAGVWGCVAAGGSLDGEGLDGQDMDLAESVSGPTQTLMRTEAGVDQYREILRRVSPGLDEPGTAERLHEQVRRLRGHWNATPHGGQMVVHWPDPGP